MNPNVNYGLLGDDDKSMQVHHCNKCTTLVGDVDNGKQGIYGNILYFPLNFAVNVKLLKNEVYPKKKKTKREREGEKEQFEEG